MLCLSSPPHPGVCSVPRGPWLRVRQRLARSGLPVTRQALARKRFDEHPGEYEIFSFPRSDFDVASHPLVRNADVVHLHWVADFVDYPTFFARVRKPIVWTLHDTNPMQGGFHYPEDALRNEERYGALERRLRDQKRRWIARADALYVVGPSRWIVERSQQSEAFAGRRHFCVPYGVDTRTFRPRSSAVCRSVFGLEERERVVAVASADLDTRRKGIDLLSGAVEIAGPSAAAAAVVGLGRGGRVGDVVRSVGAVDDPRLVALFFAAADVVVVPSREDNLPNVVIESLACGTPVVGCPVGGIPEAVEHGIDGYVTRAVSSEAIGEALRMALDRPEAFDRERIRDRAVARFSSEVQARAMLDVYREILGETRGDGSSA